MDSQEAQGSIRPPPTCTNNRFRFLKLKALYLFSILVLLTAFSFSFTETNYYKILHLKSTFSSSLVRFQNRLRFQNPQSKPPSNVQSSNCVLWMAPFLSGGGYSSEAWSYILALQDHMKNSRFRLCIKQHGDLEKREFWNGLPEKMQRLSYELHQTECRMNETVVICHSEPGAWNPPLFQTLPCPPADYDAFKFVIGRTMFETDRVNHEHVKRCNRMDAVWVPTDFHVSSFVNSGVDSSKVIKIVQPVDFKFFDPDLYEPLDLSSVANLVLGSTPSSNSNFKKPFVFLSIFKWEYRKGWDVLLRSFLKEFTGSNDVVLYLLTNAYHSSSDFGNKIVEFVEGSELKKPNKGWAPVYVIDKHIAQVDLPRLYKAADAFVLPSRGEGWGRPLVEAMAMSLPVIATNWSGPTEFLTEMNSYPLSIDGTSEVIEGPFKGHLWAEPSVSKLQDILRHVVSNTEDAKNKGRQAREDMIKRFSPEIVAGIVSSHIHEVLDKAN